MGGIAVGNQIEGYEGICRECFNPIKTGDGTRLRKGGLMFHRKCAEEHPDGHYVNLERTAGMQEALAEGRRA